MHEIAAIAALGQRAHREHRRAPAAYDPERLLDEVIFDAPDMRGQHVTVTGEMVRAELEPILANEDLSRFIL